MIIRAAGERDLAAILEIQAAAPEASQWAPLDYLQYECMAAEQEGLVVGFLAARPLAEGEWEILNLAVAPAHRKRGIARRLLNDLLERHVGEFFLEVRQSNLAARRLYSQAGFKMITQRLQYYSNPVEPAIVMKLYS